MKLFCVWGDREGEMLVVGGDVCMSKYVGVLMMFEW